MSGPRVRVVRPEDATAIAEIYAFYVRDSAITFEIEPPDATAMRGRIETVTARYPWLVAERDGTLFGYAYADVYRSRPAYRWAVETTVYVAHSHGRRGIGRALYEQLLEELTGLGFVTALGVVTLPNPASAALHESLGFVHAGTQAGVGYKLGRWHDIGMWQRDLAPRTPAPREPGGRD